MDAILIMLAAAAAAVAVTAAAFAVRAQAQARRYRAALNALDQELGPISERIAGSVERARARAEETPAASDPRLDELIDRIAEDGSAVTALRRLAEEVSSESAARRRPVLRGNRSLYEAELEREVARARRTGRPLSLLLLDVDQPTQDRLLALAALLTRVPRMTDTVCRRRRDAFGILLPETAEDGARRFQERVREEVSQTFGASRPTTLATGIVQWRPNESGEELDARARAALEGRMPGANGLTADAPA